MHTKALDDVDCDVKIHSTKVNMILIYKHINQLMVEDGIPIEYSFVFPHHLIGIY